MTGKEIIRKFKERVNKTQKRDPTTKEGYYSFCEELYKKIRRITEAKARLRFSSMARACCKKFGG